VREDVGRHNALDKAESALFVRSGADRSEGYMLITSRASFEMVQKTATVGISFLAAFSAPHGFRGATGAKDGVDADCLPHGRDRHVVYANPETIEVKEAQWPEKSGVDLRGRWRGDTIMVFKDKFSNHILPDKIHRLNVSFLVAGPAA